ncbi:MAG: DUF819 family protein [Prolixibacteraceae bacterium]|nr:DUF819 family protein [Prolixibacteraceae bacterium]
MWIILTLLLFYFLTPALLIYLCKNSTTLNKFGAVVLAYAIGLFVGNIGIFPTPSEALKNLLGSRTFLPEAEFLDFMHSTQFVSTDLLTNQIAQLQNTLLTIIIPIAIPLLLFSLNIKRWLKLAKGALLSLVLAMVSLLASIFIGYYLFAESITESSKVAGMLVGVYTGGTPNLAAIGTALSVSPNVFILTHTYDLIIGAFTLLFLMTGAQRLFSTFLQKFSKAHRHINLIEMANESS